MFAKLYQYFADMPPAEVVGSSSVVMPLCQSFGGLCGQIPPTKRLLDAAHGGHADVVLELLQSGVGFNVVNESGNKPIHIAAYEGHVSVLKLLLDAGSSQLFPAPCGSFSYGCVPHPRCLRQRVRPRK
jgi:hypothetical protein